MMNHIVTGGFSSIEQATGKFGGKRSLTNNTGTAATSSFGEILQQKKSTIAQDIDIGKARVTGHGAHLAAVSVEVKNVARLVTMVAAART